MLYLCLERKICVIVREMRSKEGRTVEKTQKGEQNPKKEAMWIEIRAHPSVTCDRASTIFGTKGHSFENFPRTIKFEIRKKERKKERRERERERERERDREREKERLFSKAED